MVNCIETLSGHYLQTDQYFYFPSQVVNADRIRFWDCLEGESKLHVQVRIIHNSIDMTDLLLEFRYKLNKVEGSVLLCWLVVKKYLTSQNRTIEIMMSIILPILQKWV